MKLYEVQTTLTKKSITCQETYYFSSQSGARRIFNRNKRLETVLRVRFSSVKVDTRLKTEDWISLLESDAPGMTCTMTPIDRITSRQLLAEWVSKPKEIAA